MFKELREAIDLLRRVAQLAYAPTVAERKEMLALSNKLERLRVQLLGVMATLEECGQKLDEAGHSLAGGTL